MSLLTLTQPNVAIRERELTAAPNFLPVTDDLRGHMTSVGRIYQVSGAGAADGHYCSFCYDSSAEFARLDRKTNYWHCCVCEAVFYD